MFERVTIKYRRETQCIGNVLAEASKKTEYTSMSYLNVTLLLNSPNHSGIVCVVLSEDITCTFVGIDQCFD